MIRELQKLEGKLGLRELKKSGDVSDVFDFFRKTVLKEGTTEEKFGFLRMLVTRWDPDRIPVNKRDIVKKIRSTFPRKTHLAGQFVNAKGIKFDELYKKLYKRTSRFSDKYTKRVSGRGLHELISCDNIEYILKNVKSEKALDDVLYIMQEARIVTDVLVFDNRSILTKHKDLLKDIELPKGCVFGHPSGRDDVVVGPLSTLFHKEGNDIFKNAFGNGTSFDTKVWWSNYKKLLYEYMNTNSARPIIESIEDVLNQKRLLD